MSTNRFKTFRLAVTAPLPAKARGQSDCFRSAGGLVRRFPSANRILQGSNIFLAAPGPRGPGDYSQFIDQGRSLTLRAPQGCLRYLMRHGYQPSLSTRLQPARMGSCARATPMHGQSVHRRTRAHILAASDYSLVKELVKALRQLTYQVRRRPAFLCDSPLSRTRNRLKRRLLARLRERNLIVASAVVNPPSGRFSSNLHGTPIDS